jgi:outer membrane protein assembly factor BamB
VVALAASDGSERWRAQLSSEVLAAPVVATDLVLVRTVDGKLYALEAASGKQRWAADQQVPRLTLRGTSKPVVAGELAISGFDNGRLMAVTLAAGNPAWDVAVGQPRGSSELQRLIDIDSPPASTAMTVAVAFQVRGASGARQQQTGARDFAIAAVADAWACVSPPRAEVNPTASAGAGARRLLRRCSRRWHCRCAVVADFRGRSIG